MKLAEELLRKHLQDHGDWPRGLVVDLWGSATMRTAGEEFAMALHLAGLAPTWDEGSERVSGFEIIPLALLNRPRIDVTLRVSGLFRDVFPGLAQMFEAGVRSAVRARREPVQDNPYHWQQHRASFGPRPGQYGLNMTATLDDYTDAGRAAAGEAWLTASSFAIDARRRRSAHARDALELRLQGADAFVHLQDLPETDIAGCHQITPRTRPVLPRRWHVSGHAQPGALPPRRHAPRHASCPHSWAKRSPA